ncbi:MAG: thioesterase family protein [Candidatus Binataceae bacterium]
MKPIPIGTIGTFSRLIGPEHLASRIESTLAPVLSTPSLVSMMELAAMDAMRGYLEPGESSVGMSIDVQHLAATPPGHRVRAEAEVITCQGRRLEFNVRAFDETEQIGSGTHRRAAIDAAKFSERLKAKQKS